MKALFACRVRPAINLCSTVRVQITDILEYKLIHGLVMRSIVHDILIFYMNSFLNWSINTIDINKHSCLALGTVVLLPKYSNIIIFILDLLKN